MADQKVSDLPSLNGADVDAADLLYIVDSSAGTAGSKKITIGQYQLAPYSAGTANQVQYLNASKVLTGSTNLTFDGTSLTLGGNPTLSAGTANGVMYLNGSNVMTSGSALTFDTATLTVNNATGGVFAADSSGGNVFRGFQFKASGTLFGYLQANGSTGELRSYIGPSSGWGGIQTWYTDNAERMRLDASGNLLVGTTDTTVGSGTGLKLIATSGVAAARMQIGDSGSTDSNIGYSMYSTGAGAYRFYVGYGGTIYATSTTITAISDQRLKENVQDLDVGLDKIMALKPRKFDWKAGKGKDIKGDRGWIAQEFEQVFPDMVDTWQDPAPEGEEPYKAVNADLIPVLVKAIQEQQVIINDLRARVAALEAQ